MLAKVLIDNIAENPLKSEWGLCIHIEFNGKSILLDTGASDRFLENAKRLGVNIENVDIGVLSHAHYDHSDGMADFFNFNSKADFYLSKAAKENCYGRRFIFSRYIGIKKGLTKKFSNRIKYAEGKVKLTDGVYLLPHTTPDLELTGKKAGMYLKENNKWVPDSFSHEQSLVVKSEKGLVIFNSCCHGGADNIIAEVSQAFPGEHIYAIVGGFHLYRSSEGEVRALAKRIKDTGIEKIYTGHCTGDKAFRILKKELGENAIQLRVGLEIEA